MVINEATVFIGRNYRGAKEAIVFSDEHKFYRYSTNLSGEIDYIYLRFSKDWFETHLQPYLQPSPNVPSLLNRVEKIRKENYKDFSHILDIPAKTGQKLQANLYLANRKVFVNFSGQIIRPMLRSDNGTAKLAIDNIWNNYQDGIFQVFYDPSSRIANIIPWWIDERKKALDAACSFLDIEWKYGPITYFIFETRDQIISYGITSGQILPSENQIFTLFDQTPGYSLAKLIAFHMTNGKEIESQLIREGLFSLLNQQLYDPDEFCRKLINKKDFKLLGENFTTCEYAYPMGASFVNFLINNYGLNTFKQFFGQNEYSEAEAFEFYYNKKGESLQKEWKQYLNSPIPSARDYQEHALKSE
ncbi:MAG: hypothetical protein ACEPOZ_03115 [Marinifilaceae bacterium]